MAAGLDIEETESIERGTDRFVLAFEQLSLLVVIEVHNYLSLTIVTVGTIAN
jgi:hypothetical protein